MNDENWDSPPSTEELHGTLRRAVDAIRGAPLPAADLDAWRRNHSQAMAFHDSQRATILAGKKKVISRIVTLAAATVLLACVWIGVWNSGTPGPSNAAFAQTVEQIQKAKTITWKCTQYWYIPKGDGTGKWEKHERQDAYKAPGVYREVRLNEEGQVDRVTITDEVNKRELRLYPKSKKAEVVEIACQSHDPRGPFHGAQEELRKGVLHWVEKRKTATGEVNVFRNSQKWDGWKWTGNWSFDLWIDPKTKQLVREQVPGPDIYDPDNDPDRNNPIGERWPNGAPVCNVFHDIVFDARLDESLFSLVPPEGYAVTVQQRNYVTEQEVIDYLGIVADANDKTFPEQTAPHQLSVRDSIDEIQQKPEDKRTAAEQKLLEAIGRCVQAHLNHMPIYHFITDNAVENSFRYLGKGVKLGDKDAVVCWYKLRDAKDPSTYRVVYGDLSVRDVAAEDLPLPVDP